MSKHVGVNVRERDSREAIPTVVPRDVGDIAGCKTSHIEIGSGLARSTHSDVAPAVQHFTRAADNLFLESTSLVTK